MARKTKTVVIAQDGRDKGRAFFLTEMPASRAERWAARAFLALARSGVEIPDEIRSAGMAGFFVLGLRALGGVAWGDAESLLEEMMACVQAIPDPARPTVIRPLVEDDIEEIATRVFLRGEVLELHTGFSLADAISRARAAALAAALSSATTPTSPQPSAP